MSKIIAATSVVILIIIVIFIFLSKNNNSQSAPSPEASTKFTIEDFKFTKEEAWGPCAQDQCYQKTILRGDGTLIKEGDNNEYIFVNTFDLLTITNRIEQTKIMGKECLAEPVTDYSANTTIHHKGQFKEIQFPGCKEELEQIEKLFPKGLAD